MATLLITGGLGFVGSTVARLLLESPDSLPGVTQIVLLDSYEQYQDVSRVGFFDYRPYRIQQLQHLASKQPSIELLIERGNVADSLHMQTLLAEHQPSWVLHAAALPLANQSSQRPLEAQEGPVVGTSVLLEALGRLQQSGHAFLQRFVYVSSSMVYGTFQHPTADEMTHPTSPIEPYGGAKLAGEALTKSLATFYNLPFSIVRPSAVYGPGDMNRRVSQIFIEKALAGVSLNVQGSDESLDFTYVEDLAQGMLLALAHPNASGEIFNLTRGEARTLLAFAEALKPYVSNLELQITERDVARPKRGTLCIDKAKRLLGYSPSVSIEEGIERTVAFIRQVHPVYKQAAPTTVPVESC